MSGAGPHDPHPVRAGFDISPHWADGYAFGPTGFVRVAEAPPGAVVIESGQRVRLAPSDPSEDWLVAGRGKGLKIAIARGSTFRSVDLRTFLAVNPRYLHGQVVERDGSTWSLATSGLAGPALVSGEEKRPIGIEDLLDSHLDTFRARAVLIVDKG